MHHYSGFTAVCLLALLFSLAQEKSRAQATWSFDFSLGAAVNVPLPLRIEQQGYPAVNLNARYETAPFSLPLYWDWRFSRRENARSWEFEAIHHKLYLRNKPDDVQGFSISHGFNLLFLNRGFEMNGLLLKTGAGIVLAHPESTVRYQQYNQEQGLFNSGYHISGPAINLALGRRIKLNNRFYLQTEAKTTYAFAKVPVFNGTAEVNNWALHLAIGLGFDFLK